MGKEVYQLGSAGSTTRSSATSRYSSGLRLNSLYFSSSAPNESTSTKTFLSGPISYFKNYSSQKKMRKQTKVLSRLHTMRESILQPVDDGDRSRKVMPANVVHDPVDVLGPAVASVRRWTFAGSGWGRIFFEFLFCITCIVSFVFSVFQLGYNFSSVKLGPKQAVFILCMDIIFILRLYLCLFKFTEAASEGDNVVGASRNFRKKYMRTPWFALDLLTVVPLNSVGSLAEMPGVLVIGAYLRLLPILQVQRSFATLQACLVKHSRNVGGSVVRMLKLFTLVMLSAYVLSAGFYRLSKEELGVITPPPVNTTHPFIFTEETVMSDFLTSFYFATQTLFTVGYGDVIPFTLAQSRYVLVCLVCGTLVHALVIACMTSVLKNLDVTSAHYKNKLEVIVHYLNDRQISLSSRAKVTEYFAFIWERQRGKLESKLLWALPAQLKDSINDGRRSTLLNIPLFQGRDLAFVDALVSSFELEILNFSEYFCTQGHGIHKFSLLTNGLLEILSAPTASSQFNMTGQRLSKNRGLSSMIQNAKNIMMPPKPVSGGNTSAVNVIGTITPEDTVYTGIELFFYKRPLHRYSIRAGKICELQSITKENLKLVFRMFPDKMNQNKLFFEDPPCVDDADCKHTAASPTKNQELSREQIVDGQEAMDDNLQASFTLLPNVNLKLVKNGEDETSLTSKYQPSRRRRRRSAVTVTLEAVSIPIIPILVDISVLGAAEKVEDIGLQSTIRSWFAWHDILTASCEEINRRRQTLSRASHFTYGAHSSFTRKINSVGMTASRHLENKNVRKMWSLIQFGIHLYFCVFPVLNLAYGENYKDVQKFWPIDMTFEVLVVLNLILIAPFSGSVGNQEHHAAGQPSRERKGSFWEQLQLQGRFGCTCYSILLVSSLLGYICLSMGNIGYWLYFRLPFSGLLLALIKEELPKLGFQFKLFQRLGTMQVVAIQIAAMVIISAHWITCGWIVFYMNDSTSVAENYSVSFYWTLVTITTVGYGDITGKTDPTRAYSVVVMVLGASMYAGFISILASISRNSEVSEHTIEHLEDCVRTYLTERDLPRKLVTDCHAYLEYASANHTRLYEKKLLQNVFPTSLIDIIKEEILGDRFFKESPVFRDLPKVVISRMIKKMEKEVFLPGYYITCGHCAETGKKQAKELYDTGVANALIYLEVGEAEILSPTDKILGKLEAGKSFAPIALFEPENQNQKLRATDFCEVWYLTCIAMNGVLAELLEDEKNGAFVDSQTTEICAQALRQRAKEATENTGNIAKNLNNAKLNKLMMMTAEESHEKPVRFVVAPDSKVQTFWHIFMFAITLYNILFASYRAGMYFGRASDQPIYLIVIDSVADLVYMIDVVLCIRCFSVEINGIIESQPTEFSKIYRASKFRVLMDFISSFPVALVVCIIAGGYDKISINVYGLLRFTTHLRGYRFTFWLSIIKARLNIQEQLTTLLVLLLTILTFAHCGGCLFYGIARWNLENGVRETWATNSTALPLMENIVRTGSDSFSYTAHPESYQRSVYWAVASLTTVGYGDYAAVANNEILYSIVLLLTGGFLYSLILNNLEEIIAHSDISSILFQRKMDDVNKYIKYRNLPHDLAHRILGYYNTLWIRQKGVEESWIHEKLPMSLRRWICIDRLGDRSVNKFPFFKKWDSVDDLVDLLTPVSYGEDTILFIQNELIYKCYVVTSGKIEYVSGDGTQVYTSFSQGDSFAEIQFLFNEPTECIARVKELVDMFVLNRVDFDIYLQQRPHLVQKFRDELVAMEPEVRKKCSLEAFTRNLGREKVNKLFQVEDQVVHTSFFSGERLHPPNSVFRRVWDLVFLLFGIYCFLSIPYRATFLRSAIVSDEYIRLQYAMGFYLFLDITTDVFLMVDIVFRATLFTRLKSGVTLWSRREVLPHYLKSIHFVVDLITVLPIDYFYRIGAIKIGDEYGQPWLVALFRVQRLLLVTRMIPLLNSVQMFIGELGFVISSGYKQIIRIGFVGVLSVHIIACFKSALGNTVINTGRSDPLEAYTVALYWAGYTMSTVGYGNIVVDSPVFALGCMVFGAFLCDAGVTATLSNILSNRDSKAGNSKRTKVSVTRFMKTHRINKDVQNRVMDYLSYRANVLGNLDESAMLRADNLPAHFRVEVVTFSSLQGVPNLGLHPMFCGFSLGLLQTMALMLQPVIFPAGSCILHPDKTKESPDDYEYKLGDTKNKHETNKLRTAAIRSESVESFDDGTSGNFGKVANLEDPGLSLFHASFANVGSKRYALDMTGDNIFFLVTGTACVAAGSKTKRVRCGILAKSSGLNSARAITHCETMALDMHQYNVLTQFSEKIGNTFESFAELVLDKDGFEALKTYLRKHKNGAFLTDLYFYRECMRYEASPSEELAKKIYNKWIGQETRSAFTLDFDEAVALSIKVQIVTCSPDLLKGVKDDVFRRFSHIIKPRFCASAEFANLISRKKRKNKPNNAPKTMDSVQEDDKQEFDYWQKRKESLVELSEFEDSQSQENTSNVEESATSTPTHLVKDTKMTMVAPIMGQSAINVIPRTTINTGIGGDNRVIASNNGVMQTLQTIDDSCMAPVEELRFDMLAGLEPLEEQQEL